MNVRTKTFTMVTKISNSHRFQLGIIGGLGPLISASFVDALYRYQSDFVKQEQDYLRIFSISDPSVPDRTQCLLNGREDILLYWLIKYFKQLLDFKCDEILVLCFTMHALFNKLPSEYQYRIRNLVTITLSKVIELQQPVLLLCTTASNKFKVFEENSLWSRASQFIIKPEEKDQIKIQHMVYQLKFLKNVDEICKNISNLVCKNQVVGWIAGCTEFSLLYETFRDKYPKLVVVDSIPLLIKYYTNKYVLGDLML